MLVAAALLATLPAALVDALEREDDVRTCVATQARYDAPHYAAPEYVARWFHATSVRLHVDPLKAGETCPHRFLPR